MRTRSALVMLSLVLTVGLAACGGGNDNNNGGTTVASGTATSNAKVIQRNPDNASKPTITIGSKNFTEEFILGEIYAQALQAAGYNVKKQLNLGSEQIALKALKAGRVDAYPEYTGTALTSFFKVKNDDVPKDPAAAYQQARSEFAKIGFTALAPTPFTDSNGSAMTQEGARKAGNITSLSQLKGKASSLTLAGPPECAQRTDCKLGLEKTYGLDITKVEPLGFGTEATKDALRKGEVTLGQVGTTDATLEQLGIVYPPK